MLAVQLTAFIGAVAVLALSAQVRKLTAYVLAIAAGSFIYIGAVDLLAEVRASRARGRVVGFVLGVVTVVVVLRLSV